MPRKRTLRIGLTLCLAALALPVAANAEGPLVPPELEQPPERIPAAPFGKYPEHWAECVRNNPSPPVIQPGIDPRGVDPASPNPLEGLRWFVDRTEPAYEQWAQLKRSGRTEPAETIWRLAGQPRFRWFGAFTRPNSRNGKAR